ncbi:pilus assembly protein, PilO [mine drainage metagenome]|uniref:Pilus assembly protein, PilO n=1 Tax=mine drainage metagenome TaxID=410659 RepID=A0A1J5R3T4_9ZZZZ
MKPLPKLSLPALDFQGLVEDFRTLDPKDPGLWPLLPRIVILAGLFLALLAAAWWFGWNSQLGELDVLHQQEGRLKNEWLAKKRQAVNLDAYRQQLAEIDRSFGALLRQLPSKAEMESLLIDINQAGLGRGLQFELFKPGNEVAKDFYAELPITIKLQGSYHDLGAFTGDIAKLSRIVTLNDVDIAAGKDNLLSMTAVAKTFRYLDEEELAKQKKAMKAKGGKK